MSATPDTHHAYRGLPGLKPADRVVFVRKDAVTIVIPSGRGRGATAAFTEVELEPYRIDWPDDELTASRRRLLESDPTK